MILRQFEEVFSAMVEVSGFSGSLFLCFFSASVVWPQGIPKTSKASRFW